MPRDTQLDQPLQPISKSESNSGSRFSRRTFLRGALASTLGVLGANLLRVPGAVAAPDKAPFQMQPWKEYPPLDISIVFGEYEGKDPVREEQAAEKIKQVLGVASALDPDFEPMVADLTTWFKGTSAGRPYREPGPVDGSAVFKFPTAAPVERLAERDRSRAIAIDLDAAASSNPALAKQFLIRFNLNPARMDPSKLQTYVDLFAAWRFSQLAHEQAAPKLADTNIEDLKAQVTGAEFIAPLWEVAITQSRQLSSKIKANPGYPTLEIASETPNQA